jgi:hypothetical protein
MRLIRIQLQGQIDIAIHPREARRHHAENRVGLVRELDGLSDHGRIAPIVPLPELVTQHCHGQRILSVRRVGRDDVSAQQGRQAEELESGPAHHDRVDVIGHITARDRLARKVEGSYVLNGMRLPKLVNLRTSQPKGSIVAGVVRRPDVADPVDSRVRPGMEHSIVEDAVDSNGCTNAKGERKDRGKRETWVTEDLPERKTEIL